MPLRRTFLSCNLACKMCSSNQQMLFVSLYVLFCISATLGRTPLTSSSSIPDEKWGYVTVRKNAHMFWWMYGAQEVKKRPNLPLVIWLQGGLFLSSSSGAGNFVEIGPLDVNLNPRNTTWSKKANLLFVDAPVGAGFSYVTDAGAYTRNVSQIAEDLFVLFSVFLDKLPVFKSIPVYIFGESYGGKIAAVFGQKLYTGIRTRRIECNFKGVALVSSWISPVDFVTTWGSYLYYFSLLDIIGSMYVANVTRQTIQAVSKGEFKQGTKLMMRALSVIDHFTDHTDIFNVLQHHAPHSLEETSDLERLYQRHVDIYHQHSLADLMDGKIREKLGIIPKNIKWGAQSNQLFLHLVEDIMKPVYTSVDKLIQYGLKVVVYQGQLDMFCNTVGTGQWMRRLKWPGLRNYLFAKSKPLYIPGEKGQTQAFFKGYKNFGVYHILYAGHMVPADNGPIVLEMLGHVINN